MWTAACERVFETHFYAIGQPKRGLEQFECPAMARRLQRLHGTPERDRRCELRQDFSRAIGAQIGIAVQELKLLVKSPNRRPHDAGDALASCPGRVGRSTFPMPEGGDVAHPSPGIAYVFCLHGEIQVRMHLDVEHGRTYPWLPALHLLRVVHKEIGRGAPRPGPSADDAVAVRDQCFSPQAVPGVADIAQATDSSHTAHSPDAAHSPDTSYAADASHTTDPAYAAHFVHFDLPVRNRRVLPRCSGTLFT